MLYAVVKIYLALTLFLASIHTTAQGGETVRIIHSSSFIDSSFAKSLNISKDNSPWPISNCPQLISESTLGINRQRMEFLILCNALRESKEISAIKFIRSGNAERKKKDLNKGKGDILGHSIYVDEEILATKDTQNITTSSPIILKNQHAIGIFTTKENLERVSKNIKEKSFQQLRVAIPQFWSENVKTLEDIGFKKVIKLPHYNNIGKFISLGRADFTTGSVNKDVINRNIDLYRVPDIKITIDIERRFLVRRQREDLYGLIEAYLHKMRQPEDLISKALYHSGYLDKSYDQWQSIN